MISNYKSFTETCVQWNLMKAGHVKCTQLNGTWLMTCSCEYKKQKGCQLISPQNNMCSWNKQFPEKSFSSRDGANEYRFFSTKKYSPFCYIFWSRILHNNFMFWKREIKIRIFCAQGWSRQDAEWACYHQTCHHQTVSKNTLTFCLSIGARREPSLSHLVTCFFSLILFAFSAMS